MRERRGWALCALTVLVLGLAILLALLNGETPGFGEPKAGAWIVAPVAVLAFSVAGALIVGRQPRNPIGWIFGGASLALAFTFLAEEYGTYALYTESGELPGGPEAIWLAAWLFFPGLFSLVTFFFLLFPDGRLPSRRWRPAVWLAAFTMTALALGYAFAPGPIEEYPQVENPVGIGGDLARVAEGIGWPLLPVAVLVSASALIVRFRRARGEERLQLKWVAAAGVVNAVCLALMVVLWFAGFETPATLLMLVGLLVLTAAAGVAILKYRLYDIDVVINRALVYGALTATLAAAYLGSVLLLQAVLSPGSDLAVAASTLAVAALFRPARTRIQALVDRRFYRRRYDAARTLDRFGARLRDQIDLDALGGELAASCARPCSRRT